MDTPRAIPDLAALAYEAKHIRAHKALALQSDEVQVNVYLLEPGGRIPAHRHTTSWDITYVIEGEIEARWGVEGALHTTRTAAGALNLVPPGVAHEIVNPGPAPARFLLVQSPSRGFDFVRCELPGAP
jgi:quercetin dioxygenase-like cupin family protein